MDWMMNENIEAMVAELELAFPIKWEQHDKIKDLHFEIYDDRGYKFGIDKEFVEKRLTYIRINYKGKGIQIITFDENDCGVVYPNRMSWDEFKAIGSILNITSKYISRIELSWKG